MRMSIVDAKHEKDIGWICSELAGDHQMKARTFAIPKFPESFTKVDLFSCI